MSKRKPAIASKRARRPKIAARAQRNKQAVVRSPKDNPLRSVAAGATDSPLKPHDDLKRSAPDRVTALQDGCSQMMRDNNPKKGFDFSLAPANMQAYQATLLEMAQANMQFAFEFSQRLATIRSPCEFFAVIAEFASRRIDMFRKYSEEMAGYPFTGNRRVPRAHSSAGTMTSSRTAACFRLGERGLTARERASASAVGTFRKCRNVRLESGMHQKRTFLDHSEFSAAYCIHPRAASISIRDAAPRPSSATTVRTIGRKKAELDSPATA
ncbi:phasin family protein [Bradyrhizobium sp. TZ2]